VGLGERPLGGWLHSRTEAASTCSGRGKSLLRCGSSLPRPQRQSTPQWGLYVTDKGN